MCGYPWSSGRRTRWRFLRLLRRPSGLGWIRRNEDLLGELLLICSGHDVRQARAVPAAELLAFRPSVAAVEERGAVVAGLVHGVLSLQFAAEIGESLESSSYLEIILRMATRSSGETSGQAPMSLVSSEWFSRISAKKDAKSFSLDDVTSCRIMGLSPLACGFLNRRSEVRVLSGVFHRLLVPHQWQKPTI